MLKKISPPKFDSRHPTPEQVAEMNRRSDEFEATHSCRACGGAISTWYQPGQQVCDTCIGRRDSRPKEFYPPRINRDLLPGMKAKLEKDRAALAAGHGLFFTGPAGSGKTTRAVAAILDREARFEPIAFISLYDYTTHGPIAAAETEQKAVKYKIVILDDLAVPKMDWTLGALETLFDGLYRRQRQMIVTSNLPMGDKRPNINEDISARIYGRILERCAMRILSKSHRKPVKA